VYMWKPFLRLWKIKVKTDQNQIEVGNIVVDVVRKDIKNLHLRVYSPT
jgi:hypothetical protein